ncbi:unnamed protein product [Coffea canephora]|uniref:Uncharacterized protein n=1 Tax=Coffea canephora TaxID=49390 RepID=A0A068V769_COFCA|nr:unnamed protein product [Coffea canephora]
MKKYLLFFKKKKMVKTSILQEDCCALQWICSTLDFQVKVAGEAQVYAAATVFLVPFLEIKGNFLR